MESKSPHILTDSPFNGFFAVCQADITPLPGIYSRNWSAAKFEQSTGIHQPLLMQCLVIKNSRSSDPLVLLTADLGWWKNSADERDLRYALLSAFNLRESQLLFCLSHTHAGPGICSQDKDKPGGNFILPYLERLKSTALELITGSLNKLTEGSLSWGYGLCDLATNRDFKHGDGYLVGYNPEKEADQTLLAGLVRDKTGKILCTLVNYACHPTTLAHENSLLSPDYVGSARQIVSESSGGAPCLFLQGASGELAPKDQYVDDITIVENNGKKLGYAVLSLISGMRPVGKGLEFKGAISSGAPLAIWGKVDLQIDERVEARIFEVKVDLKNLPTQDEIESKLANTSDPVLEDRLWRMLNTRRSVGNTKEAVLKVWVWQLGGALIVAQANEAYSVFQSALREKFGRIPIAVINIANGYIGYLPPFEMYEKDMYAVWQTPYDKGTLEQLINGTIEGISTLLNEASTT